MCLCSPSSINWYRLRLGVKCTTGAVLNMLAAIRRGGPCGWRPTGATQASFLPVVAVVQRPWSDFCHLRRYISWCSFTFLAVFFDHSSTHAVEWNLLYLHEDETNTFSRRLTNASFAVGAEIKSRKTWAKVSGLGVVALTVSTDVRDRWAFVYIWAWNDTKHSAHAYTVGLNNL